MATVKRENGDLTPQEKKEVQEVLDHAENCQITLKNVATNFGKKWSIGLTWDSKVPKNGQFYHLFTFRMSDKIEVIEEIVKYEKFYKEMSEVTRHILNNKGGETSERDKDICTLVEELLKHLETLNRAAVVGEKTTDSSTVYRQHREFIKKHEKLQNLIKKIKFVALQQYREQSMVIIEKLKTDLQKSEGKLKVADVKSKRLTTALKEVENEKETLEQANDLMQQQNGQLLEKSNGMKKQLEDLAEEMDQLKGRLQDLSANQAEELETLRREKRELEEGNERLGAGQQHMAEEMDQLKGQLQDLSANQAEELESLRREKQELEERNERLEQERRDQSRAMQELSERQEELFKKNEMVWKEMKKIQDERSGSSDTSSRHPGL